MEVMMMKRTTIALDDGLIRQIKEKSLREGKNFQVCLNELLFEALEKQKHPKNNSRKIPTFRMGEPRVDITDRTILLDALDEP